MVNTVATRFLILSDTHGAQPEELNTTKLPGVDAAIHCGDLTQDSRVDEYHTAIHLLKAIKAPLKLVIAGNHDWSLDPAVYGEKLNQATSTSRPAATEFQDVYDAPGQARALLNAPEAQAAGIVLLDEGTHTFTLPNGASLIVYASPYTPSTLPGWGFQYNVKHDWAIGGDVDIAMTHGPPVGIFDRATPFGSAGCPDLFAGMAKARPLMHCFGHVHSGWGAQKVVWRSGMWYDGIFGRWWRPTHGRSIDHGKTVVLEALEEREKEKVAEYASMAFCTATEAIARGKETLFVNAAVEGTREIRYHPAWIVDLELSCHEAK